MHSAQKPSWLMHFSSQWIQFSGTCSLQWAILTIYSSCKQCACMHSAQHYIHPVDQAQYTFLTQVLIHCMSRGNTPVCESSTDVIGSEHSTSHEMICYMYVHLWLICIYWATLTIFSCCKQSAAMHAPYEPITVAWQSIEVIFWQQSIYRQLAVS